MRLAVLFSGGKDSAFALYKASKLHKISCLITLDSKNPDSYMFHTPVDKVDFLAQRLSLPLIKISTLGKKETELQDLKLAIQKAKRDYKIQGLVTGAVASIYQASRIQSICHELDLYCFNPLWQKDQLELINELVKEKFKVKIVKVAADGLDESWIGKIIDKTIIQDLIDLNKKKWA